MPPRQLPRRRPQRASRSWRRPPQSSLRAPVLEEGGDIIKKCLHAPVLEEGGDIIKKGENEGEKVQYRGPFKMGRMLTPKALRHTTALANLWSMRWINW